MLEYTPKVRSFMDLDSWRNRNNLSQEKLNTKVNEHLSIGEKENSSNRPRSFLDITNGKRPPRIQTFPEKFKYQRNLNLTSTPISFFPEDELIIYLKDKLYSLSTSPDKTLNKQKINFLGQTYYATEFDSFLNLEKDYIEKNKEEIEKFKKSYINKLSEENTLIKDQYDFLERTLKNSDSLDSLVKNYFFPITKGIDIEKIISDNKKNENFERKIDVNKIRELQFNHSVSYFNNLFSDKNSPFLITNKELYCISNELKFVEEISNCERKYKKFISEKIKEKIKNNVDSYFKGILQNDKRLQNLNEKIHTATYNPHRDFGTERISETEYVLFKNVGEYGVEWDGKFYLFPPLKVGAGLTKTSSGYKIDKRAFVYKNPYYKHPYIQGGKGGERREICTAGRLNLIHSQIELNSTSSKDKAYLMKSVKKLLGIFEEILKAGHNSNHIPMDTIQKSSRLISRTEAENYKRRRVEFFKKTYGN